MSEWNSKLTVQPWQLAQRMSLPLECKIRLSQMRIHAWYSHWQGNVFVSYSGGKDSSVLLHLVRGLYGDVPAVFVDTGLEYPEVREHALSTNRVVTLKPKMSFKQVLEKRGYPVVSKAVSGTIRKLTQLNLSERHRNKLLNGDERGSMGKLPAKWRYLLQAPFKISDFCCLDMKERPIKAYMHATKCKPFIGVMAVESNRRRFTAMKHGCNMFSLSDPVSAPLAFWTEDDVLEYILQHNVTIPSVYGQVQRDLAGKPFCSGVQRTGCMFCMFGAHMDAQPNRFQRMKVEHPSQYDYCMNKLGLFEVCRFLDIAIV